MSSSRFAEPGWPRSQRWRSAASNSSSRSIDSRFGATDSPKSATKPAGRSRRSRVVGCVVGVVVTLLSFFAIDIVEQARGRATQFQILELDEILVLLTSSQLLLLAWLSLERRHIDALRRDLASLGRELVATRHRAWRDEVTGLLRRSALVELDGIRRDAASGSDTRCLVLLDLDHFKTVNDLHGHPTGDLVLRTVARRISDHVESSGEIARFGGDEFAILMPTAPAELWLKSLRWAVSAPVTLPSGISLQVTASAGVAELPYRAPFDELYERADAALLGAKAAHRPRTGLVPLRVGIR